MASAETDHILVHFGQRIGRTQKKTAEFEAAGNGSNAYVVLHSLTLVTSNRVSKSQFYVSVPFKVLTSGDTEVSGCLFNKNDTAAWPQSRLP